MSKNESPTSPNSSEIPNSPGMSIAKPTYSRWQIWMMASRPKTLWAAVAPVIIGGAIAVDADHKEIFPWIAALLGAVLIQIGTNFANDLFDFKKATDTEERLGPLRVTQAGLVTPAQMRNATIIAFALAFLTGVYLVVVGGWPIVAIGLLSILFGVLYTGGPFPLGYNGLGEIFVFIFFGPVAVGGTYYVMAKQFSIESLIMGISPGLLSCAILVVNNLRDIETDRKTNKRTLAVMLGKRFTQIEYIVLVLLAMIIPSLWFAFTGEHAFALLTLVAIIPAVAVVQTVIKQSGKVLNTALAGTGKVLALFSILFAIGWLL